ncbi:MAG: hypothetical protein ACYTKD_28840 [Planctomycetota bacterium]|jgi:hypothetical protein
MMSEEKKREPDAESPAGPSGVEDLVGESLRELRMTDGLVDRIMAALPSREEMKPALNPALRLAFGLTTVLFSIGAWSFDLPGWYGAGGAVRKIALGALTLWGAFGATIIGLGLMREAGHGARASFRAVFQGPRARTLVATVSATIVLAAAWGFLGWFPPYVIDSGLRATRASVAAVVFVLLAVAAIQLWIMARGRDWRPALRLVEAVGLVAAGLACAANYVIFVA